MFLPLPTSPHSPTHTHTQLLQESDEDGGEEDDGSYREEGGAGVGISDLYDALYDINDSNMSAEGEEIEGKGKFDLFFI